MAQSSVPRTHVLAHALVLPGHLDKHLAWLAGRHGAGPKPRLLGRIGVDDASMLNVPPAHPLH